MAIKFGLHIEPQLGYDFHTVQRLVKVGEDLGFDSFWVSDHLFLDNKSEERNCMDAWTILAALGSVTKKIRLGTLVTCNSYRYPPLLAKIAASVDHISNGRLFFGYGAGWKKVEYRAYGYTFPSWTKRFDQMEEALQIIKRLWTEPKTSFSGKYYKIKDAFSAPKPVQKPHPPILVGGTGPKRTLKIVAKYADYCNLWPEENIQKKLDILKEHCENVGRNYDEVGKSFFCVSPVYVAKTDDELQKELMRRARARGQTVEEVIKAYKAFLPGTWVGFPDEVMERFQHLIDLGFDYFQVRFYQAIGEQYSLKKTLKVIRTFTDTVMKKL